MRIAHSVSLLFLTLILLGMPASSRSQVAVGISIRIGPPALPVYVQPVCPGPGYIWIPGYWAYGPDGYFWVPGTWVEPPEVGLLWTPGYWEWLDGVYIWHAGYWGPEVGYYGGIYYGFGYTGVGFFGGYWRGDTYYYNRAVTNVDVTVVRSTYNTTVVNNNTRVNRVSFNGGPGGTTVRPTSQQIAEARQKHVSMTPEQMHHQQSASTNQALLASVNHGRPHIAATAKPGQFTGRGTVESGRPSGPNRPSEIMNEKNRPRIPRSNANEGRNGPGGSPAIKPPQTAPVNPSLKEKHQQEMERPRQQPSREKHQTEPNPQQPQRLDQRDGQKGKVQQKPEQRQEQQKPERPQPPAKGSENNRGHFHGMSATTPHTQLPNTARNHMLRYIGTASWYGKQHQGKKMANGQRFDRHKLTAASWYFPLGTPIRVLNLENGKSVLVTITDRGPNHRLHRILDLSQAAAERLGYVGQGLTSVFFYPVASLDALSVGLDSQLIEPRSNTALPALEARVTNASETLN